MTHEEIDRLEGVPLNEAVATEVFGWPSGLGGCLDYSINPTSMMEVVEKMRKAWGLVEIYFGENVTADIHSPDGRWLFRGKGDTAPAAVCRASLKAVLAGKGEK